MTDETDRWHCRQDKFIRRVRTKGLRVDGENGAGSQLHHPIGCRTKHRYIQGATATHSHNHQVDLRFHGELNDLRVWFSDARRRPNFEALASLRWNQLIQSLS